MKLLRSKRGWAEVARALELDESVCEPGVSVERCRALLPDAELVLAERPSRARPSARGRWLAGEITLFPAAFADPRTLAYTLLHELAHARGADEAEADATACAFLSAEGRP